MQLCECTPLKRHQNNQLTTFKLENPENNVDDDGDNDNNKKQRQWQQIVCDFFLKLWTQEIDNYIVSLKVIW